MKFIGAKYHIHKGKPLKQPGGHVLLLHHATANGDAKRRILVLLFFQRSHVAKNPLFRVLPNAAGIKKDKVRRLLGGRGLKTGFT